KTRATSLSSAHIPGYLKRAPSGRAWARWPWKGRVRTSPTPTTASIAFVHASTRSTRPAAKRSTSVVHRPSANLSTATPKVRVEKSVFGGDGFDERDPSDAGRRGRRTGRRRSGHAWALGAGRRLLGSGDPARPAQRTSRASITAQQAHSARGRAGPRRALGAGRLVVRTGAHGAGDGPVDHSQRRMDSRSR